VEVGLNNQKQGIYEQKSDYPLIFQTFNKTECYLITHICLYPLSFPIPYLFPLLSVEIQQLQMTYPHYMRKLLVRVHYACNVDESFEVVMFRWIIEEINKLRKQDASPSDFLIP
jgi:hypothetical protein